MTKPINSKEVQIHCVLSLNNFVVGLMLTIRDSIEMVLLDVIKV